MIARGRPAWVFAFAASAALAGQTLLLAERQCRRLENALREDFRVVLFLRGPLDESKLKILEEKLRAQPETEELRYVSPAESLAALRREDPALVDAVALVGENPLPGAFELKPASDALPRLASWVDAAQALSPEWSDVRWKQAQLQAILRARLYGHWLRLVLSTLLCASVALALWTLASLGGGAGGGRFAWAGIFGGAVGIASAALAAWPLRRDELLWSWPSAWTQAAMLAVCAGLGWCFSQWRAES